MHTHKHIHTLTLFEDSVLLRCAYAVIRSADAAVDSAAPTADDQNMDLDTAAFAEMAKGDKVS